VSQCGKQNTAGLKRQKTTGDEIGFPDLKKEDQIVGNKR